MRALAWLATIAGLLAFFVGLPVAMAYLEDTLFVPISILAAGVGWLVWMVWGLARD